MNNPHPFNPTLVAKRQNKAAEKRRQESDNKHASAMRKIDDINFDKALKRELDDLEL